MSFPYLQEQCTSAFGYPSHDILTSRPILQGSMCYLDEQQPVQQVNHHISITSVQNELDMNNPEDYN